MSASAAELYADFLVENAAWKTGTGGTQMRTRTAYNRFFRQACAEGNPPDALRRQIADEQERFFSQTIPGIDGHTYWDGPQRFTQNDGRAFAPARWWWFHTHPDHVGRRGKVVPACGERHCITPSHCEFVDWRAGHSQYSDQTILGAIQTVAMRIGRTPTRTEYEQHIQRPSLSLVIYRFGSWSQAVTAAGLVPRGTGVNAGVRTDAELLAAMREHAVTLGHAPSRWWWEHHVHSPSAAAIFRRFGSWDAALQAAGLERERPLSPTVYPAGRRALQAAAKRGEDAEAPEGPVDC